MGSYFKTIDDKGITRMHMIRSAINSRYAAVEAARYFDYWYPRHGYVNRISKHDYDSFEKPRGDRK
jgi:hypothetical protein